MDFKVKTVLSCLIIVKTCQMVSFPRVDLLLSGRSLHPDKDGFDARLQWNDTGWQDYI